MHKQSLALKFSFVFVVLSMAISLLTAAWQLAQGKSGSLLLVLETGAGLLLVLLPALLSKWLRFYLPAFLYFFFLAFIYCAIYLGDAYHFYYIPYWDKFLHLISEALLFGLAWAILGCFKSLRKSCQPAFCACTGWPLPSSAGSSGNAMSLPVTVFSP
ncbi:hypothetical protein ACXO8C_04765 [Lactobacillus delbrueckii subsp. bulgaricus]